MSRNDGDETGREIWFLNRGVLVVRPAEPFVRWVQTTDERVGGEPVAPEVVRTSVSSHLIPDFDYTEDSWQWIRDHCETVFAIELNGWFSDPELWPADRSWSAFQEWFELELIDLAWDLVDEPLSSQPPLEGADEV